MSNLVAIGDDDMSQAQSGMGSIGELHRENGKLKLHQPSLAGLGAASGAAVVVLVRDKVVPEISKYGAG